MTTQVEMIYHSKMPVKRVAVLSEATVTGSFHPTLWKLRWTMSSFSTRSMMTWILRYRKSAAGLDLALTRVVKSLD